MVVHTCGIQMVSDMVLQSFITERLEFHILPQDNPQIKRTLLGLMYEEYLSDQGHTRV